MVFILYMYNLDTKSFDQLFGVFDSRIKFEEQLQIFENEFDCELSEEDYQIIETRLNKNLLTEKQIML